MTAIDPWQPFAIFCKFLLLLMTRSHTTIVLILSSAIAACAGDQFEENPEVPEIVEIFACGDYCPGPEEEYLKRIYDGVTDEEECRKLGGRLYMWIDWQQRTVCEVR